MSHPLFKEHNGTTLLEVLVAMSIFVVLSAGAIALFLNSFHAQDTVWKELGLQDEGRVVLSHMTASIRKAEESNIGSYPVKSASGTEFVFYANIDGDPLKERIHFFRDGDMLVRGVTKPAGEPFVYSEADETTSTLIHHIVNEPNDPVFSYYDESYSGSGSALPSPIAPTSVHLVRIHLVLDNDQNAPPAPLTMNTVTEIRNVKQNY